jgi:L-alanine-DL-glutamate epimerase-like enolase superfamily enzyme
LKTQTRREPASIGSDDVRGPSEPIRKITVYALQVPLAESVYKMSGGRSITGFDVTLVRIEGQSGLYGWGEITPLGQNYLPAFSEGARAGIAKVAPDLIGEDALQLDRVYATMNAALQGHPYVKSALDMACWDLLGRRTRLPACTLLGGRFGGDMAIYWATSKGTPEEMVENNRRLRSLGIRHFQLKVGGEPELDVARIRAAAADLQSGETLVADANGGWTLHEAARVASQIDDLDVYLEQPCATYAECLAIRRRCRLPFVLDESIDTLEALMKACADGAMDAVNLKTSRVGGLTPARLMRDICVANGIALSLEDAAGADVASAAVTHLAQSTPERLRLSVALSSNKLAHRIGAGGPVHQDGLVSASTEPGLGVEPFEELLGEPLIAIP